MQYKKDEMRERLIQSGENEFFKSGFEGSSIRRIVKAAGTTIGNFYNYFKNKEELFREITEGEMKRFSDFLYNHQEVEAKELLWDEIDPEEIYRWLDESTDMIMTVFNRRFYILVACSNGTAYGSARGLILEYIKDHFMGHAFESRNELPELEKTSDVLANQFLDGLLFILHKYSDVRVTEQLIKNQIFFFLMGVAGLLKGGLND